MLGVKEATGAGKGAAEGGAGRLWFASWQPRPLGTAVAETMSAEGARSREGGGAGLLVPALRCLVGVTQELLAVLVQCQPLVAWRPLTWQQGPAPNIIARHPRSLPTATAAPGSWPWREGPRDALPAQPSLLTLKQVCGPGRLVSWPEVGAQGRFRDRSRPG